MATEKQKVTTHATMIADMNKKYGGRVEYASKGVYETVDVIPTGIPSLNIALGCGGWPRGRIIEMFGPEGVGKSTTGAASIAKCQNLGGTCCYMDAEFTFDVPYARRVGINTDELVIGKPDCAEQAFQMLEEWISYSPDLIIVDSIPALVPQAVIDGKADASHVAILARQMTQFLNRNVRRLEESRTVLIFMNQLRDKIGGMVPGMTSTGGGRALRHYASIRVKLWQEAKETRTFLKIDEESVGGIRVSAEIVKNKVAPPYRKASYVIVFGQGPRIDVDLVDLSVAHKIIEGGGVSHYRLNIEGLSADDRPRLGAGLGGICNNMKKTLRDLNFTNEDVGVDLDTPLYNLLYLKILDNKQPETREQLLKAFNKQGGMLDESSTTNKPTTGTVRPEDAVSSTGQSSTRRRKSSTSS